MATRMIKRGTGSAYVRLIRRRAPLGKLQLERLLGLASPSMLLVVGDKLSAALVKRGLLKPRLRKRPNAWHGITPTGMRVLADAYEAGQLKQFMKPFPPKRKMVSPAHRGGGA